MEIYDILCEKMKHHERCLCVLGVFFAAGSMWAPLPSRQSLNLPPPSSPQRHTLIKYVSFSDGIHLCHFVFEVCFYGEVLTAQCVSVCVVQVQGFFSSLKERGSQMRSAREALETIRLNQRWMDKNLPMLQRYL